MAVGLASGVANSILDALCRSVAWSEPAEFWVKLHTGDPGAAGAGNAAGETTRKQATFSAASGGAITTSAALEWTNVSTSETYSHVSFWSASAAGTFLGSDALNASKAVVAADNFTIAAGDLDLDLTPIAA
jgi:hypothetical protein